MAGRRRERRRGRGSSERGERRKINKELEDDRWVPVVVVGIEKEYRGWMGAVKLEIE